ncbi:hypothetical protein NKI32_15015 [Mesorhizobium sp. M0761]|uniref:hypothetical protein n=1 Tax=Mesorhizobium sp. M0761 TaxID=2956994 RepID=UPI0033394F8F
MASKPTIFWYSTTVFQSAGATASVASKFLRHFSSYSASRRDPQGSIADHVQTQASARLPNNSGEIVACKDSIIGRVRHLRREEGLRHSSARFQGGACRPRVARFKTIPGDLSMLRGRLVGHHRPPLDETPPSRRVGSAVFGFSSVLFVQSVWKSANENRKYPTWNMIKISKVHASDFQNEPVAR